MTLFNRVLDEDHREALNILWRFKESASEVTKCCPSCFAVVAEYASCVSRDVVKQNFSNVLYQYHYPPLDIAVLF